MPPKAHAILHAGLERWPAGVKQVSKGQGSPGAENGVQAEREAALIPAGMRIFPEEERVEMLEALAATRSELEKQVQACTPDFPSPPTSHVNPSKLVNCPFGAVSSRGRFRCPAGPGLRFCPPPSFHCAEVRVWHACKQAVLL